MPARPLVAEHNRVKIKWYYDFVKLKLYKFRPHLLLKDTMLSIFRCDYEVQVHQELHSVRRRRGGGALRHDEQGMWTEGGLDNIKEPFVQSICIDCRANGWISSHLPWGRQRLHDAWCLFNNNNRTLASLVINSSTKSTPVYIPHQLLCSLTALVQMALGQTACLKQFTPSSCFYLSKGWQMQM